MGFIFKLRGPISLSEEGTSEGLRSLVSQNVVVLAENFSLSQAQWNVLNRGLTFIPVVDLNKNQKAQLQFDLQSYHRRIKLALYFGNRRRQLAHFTGISDWTPPLDKLPPEANILIKEDQKEFHRHFKNWKEQPNLSQEEEDAIKELMGNKHIVIKPADKGSAVVILGRDQYIFEVTRQLSDTNYYTKLNRPIYLQTVPIVRGILDSLFKQGFINAKQRRYLQGSQEPRARRFYILPKIHKDPEKWTVPFKIPPGRPIVSDCNSETYQTAEYIDYYLNPLSVKHPAYVKDTYHFISLITMLQIPLNSFFFTIDIDSLYTNIDIPAGLKAVKNIFQKYPAHRPDKELLELLEINLTKNDFEFNNEYYLQIKGTAMGKRFAPAYANIFMADWEERALNKCDKKPFCYFRYLDDIFGIWTYSKDDFEVFITTLDTFDPSIRLKYQFHEHSIDFLDTTVYKGSTFCRDHKLDIKVYFKETDTHALLFKTSFHPKHTFRGLIKSQLLRFRRICTRDHDFREAVQILFRTLRTRGYSRPFLRRCLKTFEDQATRDEREKIPLITSFSTVATILNSKIKTNFHEIIEKQGLLKSYHIISAYRRNRNLKDYLVRAKLPQIQRITKPNILSGNFVRLQFIYNRKKKTVFKISQSFSPHSTNCVYVIFCGRCGKQYIGETGNSISTRMMQHRYNVKNRKHIDTPFVKHFIAHGWSAVRVSGIQGNSLWTVKERKQAERRWIRLLDSKEPLGLNKKWN